MAGFPHRRENMEILEILENLENLELLDNLEILDILENLENLEILEILENVSWRNHEEVMGKYFAVYGNPIGGDIKCDK